MTLFGFTFSSRGSRHDAGGPSQPRRAHRRDRRGTQARFRPWTEALENRALLSNNVWVTDTNDSGPGSLRNAINNAVSGDVINFARSAYGTITLTSGPLFVNMINLTIQGPGANNVTINGGGNFTDFILFTVLPPTDPPPPSFVPNSVSISGLTIANGNAINNGFTAGGAILNFDALTLSGDVLQNNQAPTGFGGAIYSGCCSNASLTLDNDLFTGNTAGSVSAPPYSYALGGAIFNTNGVATINDSTFENNQAIGPNAQGGAIQTSFTSTLNISECTFANNQAIGSQYGAGGAIFGDPAFVTINSSQFVNNLAEGSSPYLESSGGAIVTSALDWNNLSIPVTETITNSLFSGNRVVGTPGSGNPVDGGAIDNYDGTLVLASDRFTGNQAEGGSSSTVAGGYANGGAVATFACSLQLTEDSFFSNEAVGGSSPLGATFAIGGAVNSLIGNPSVPNSTSNINNCEFSGNQAVAGSGGGTYSLTAGGAIGYSESPVNIRNSSFVANQIVGSQEENGGAGTAADGGAIWATYSTMTIQGGLITENTAIGGSGGNASGGTGGNGGNADGGGIADQGDEVMTISGATITGNTAIGGAGGQGATPGVGGSGLGGGVEIDATSSLVVTGTTIAENSAIGGAAGGDGFGGGVYTLGTTTFTDTLITFNQAIGGSDGGQGVGGGIYIAGGTTTLAAPTSVSGNHATTSHNNIFGPYSI